MKPVVTALLSLGLFLGMTAQGVLFRDTFDDEPADPGPPEKYNVFGHEVADRGVTSQTAVSGEQAAYVSADFDKDTWGVIFIHDVVAEALDLSDAVLSVQISSSLDFSDMRGCVGFKLVDADGTGARTRHKDLCKPAYGWQVFWQSADDLVQVDEAGEEPGLDLRNIVQYGLIFFDRGDHNEMANFYIDDFEATPQTD